MDSAHNWLTFPFTSPGHGLLEAFSNPNIHHGGGGGEELPKLDDLLGRGMSTGGVGIYDSDLKAIAAGFVTPEEAAGDQERVSKAIVSLDTRRALDTFGQRTSIYRGVTRHRWTGRYEAHLWDNSCRREGQSRKGRQVYLGGYDKEDKAARAYDLAALKYWGPTTTTNFPVSNYEKEMEDMKSMTRQEFIASLRRKSSGFSRGASIYRGVTRHHQHGRWQARIGRVAGNKDLYLGTFSTQEEAAEAYDIAAIKFRGLNAVTNFDMSRYDIKSIMNNNLPVGAKACKGPESSPSSSPSVKLELDYWSLLALQQCQQSQHPDYCYGYAGNSVPQENGGSFGWCNGVYQYQYQQQQQQQNHLHSISSSSSSTVLPHAAPWGLSKRPFMGWNEINVCHAHDS